MPSRPKTPKAPRAAARRHTQTTDRASRSMWDRSRTSSLALLDGIATGAEGVAGVQDRVAAAMPMPVLASLVRGQAALTREVTYACVQTTRERLSR